MSTATNQPRIQPTLVRAASLDELRQRGCIVVSGGRHGIAVFWHEGKVYAVDNRCPHMGFPLSRGSLKEGILTCHWHHARFDLESGGTFDPFADDVTVYRTELRDGEVWVDPRVDGRDRTARWLGRLQDGLEQNLSLVTAKSILALEDLGAPAAELLRTGGLYGARYRQAGWGPGLTIMTAMANVLPDLAAEHRPLALYHGLTRVARDTTGQPPRFDLDPLPDSTTPLERLAQWYREFIQVRHSDGAERCLRSAIAQGATLAQVAAMMGAAATDHPYINGGHTLDFTNKAFELLEHIGWQHAAEILPSLVGQTARAARNEESSAWRYPVDLIAILHDAEAQLPALLERGERAGRPWDGFEATVEALLDDRPESGVQALVQALADGATLNEVSQALCYAAALRIARFHTSNEFGDWITVLHTFSYCNALDHMIERAPTPELARGLLAGALAVYLDRFLNMPPQRLPDERSVRREPEEADVLLARLLELTNQKAAVEEAAATVYRYLSLGHDDRRLVQTLGYVLLREDAEFHSYQMLEAGLRQYHRLKATHPALAWNVLVAVARYLAAHSPTDRATTQTYTIALRLHRGEELYKE